MVVADLHLHTTNSDGEMTLADVPAAAREADVSAVAVTDHDCINSDLSTPVAHLDGITVVHGIELRVETGDQRLDLLGYGVQPTDELEALVDRLQRDRMERGRTIVECLEDELGVNLDLESRPGIGRPHIARATAEASDLTYQGVFDEYIYDGGPCYAARDVPCFEDGVHILEEACGLVGLAHPFRYDDPAAALKRATDLDAVERYYPYDDDPDPGPVERVARKHDLVLTGGSDAHGHHLGRAGLDRVEYRQFRSRLDLG